MDGTTILIIVAFWLICGIGAYLITAQKGRDDAGSAGVMGFVMGPIGLIMAAMAPSPPDGYVPRICVNCGKKVAMDREKLCNNCGLPFATKA